MILLGFITEQNILLYTRVSDTGAMLLVSVI